MTLRPCVLPGGGETVRCGRLEAPEDWRRPDGRKIGINLVYLPKTGGGPDQPPVVWLEGGPGIPGTASAPLYENELKFHRSRRAVILFDLRGTGGSNPLHCPATESRSALSDLWTPANVSACRRELETRADLRQYTTEAAARDLDAIRAAFGQQQIDIMALSYGSILAQAYMQLYPARVRAAALIGSVPLGEKLPLHHAANAEVALRQLFADCRAEAGCREAFPDLPDDWTRLMRRLRARPAPIAGGAGPELIRAGPFGEAIRNQLNAVETRRALPLIIHAAAGGDFRPFLASVQAPGPELADGLYLSISCPEATRRISPREIGRATAHVSLGRYRVDQQIVACRLWTPAVANAARLRPVTSEVPVLLMSGGRDATAPTFWARRIARRLKRSRVVVIEPMTHVPVGLSDMVCLDRIMDAFFSKASTKDLDTACIGSMRPPPFKLPPEGPRP